MENYKVLFRFKGAEENAYEAEMSTTEVEEFLDEKNSIQSDRLWKLTEK
ncbi:hypothetical protein [Planococcus koreensis]